MNKLIFAAITLLGLGTPALAQTETLIQSSNLPRLTGWYIAPSSSFTNLDGRMGHALGLRGAVMLDERFGIGLAGALITTSGTTLERNLIRDVGGYGGLYLQYIFLPDRLIHAYLDLTLGTGSWCSETREDECNERLFAVIEPTVNAELNVSPHFKVALGVGWRQALAERGPGLGSADLSGFVARTSVILGSF
jgi:hypothetical protein